MKHSERIFLATLDNLIRQAGTLAVLREKGAELQSLLTLRSEVPIATQPIALEIYGAQLPPSIKSSRLVAYKGGTIARIERHPNSQQRVLCLEGTGTIFTIEGEARFPHPITAENSAQVEERWCSVEENIWHQPVAGPATWIVLALHTATEQHLLDEYL
ncbi:hypothetical protein EPA93_01200 [Ktedonosporobacter rubrisoli]|uniref:Cupin domain-containing protein n=1 Tax=Ktedonosporobacter rubrisoli TaxID=2509675 RepID=A0A4P6JI04_KTERU|nr:hypothetical protein [Ktedonosporobacter rubrisoli]QBD74678.1 hypothetical protein EPA93_01200 [Ktedonosporobacter rubrisoli]